MRPGCEAERTVTFRKYEELGAYHWAWADRSSVIYAPAAEARYAIVAKRIEAGHRVLDIGCGDGYLMNLAADRGAVATGVDTEATGLALARQMLGEPRNLRLVRADATRLPLLEGSFDRVLLVDVVEHLVDPEPCLSEIGRMLAPDGWLLVTTPKWRPGRMWDEANHVREYRPEELADQLRAFFKDVSLSFFIPNVWWQVRRRLGKGLIRTWSRYLYNPFLREGGDADGFCHILAVCGDPR